MLEWIKDAQAAQGQETLERLLDAAEAMLEESAWEAISVAALVARARSSVGAFYARFPDKDAVLQQLHARHCMEALQTAASVMSRERWAGMSLDVVIRALVEFSADVYAARAGFYREMMRRCCMDAGFRQRAADVSAQRVRLLAALLEERASAIAVPDTLIAAEMLHRIAIAIFDQHVAFADRGPCGRPIDIHTIADEIVKASLAYLRWQGRQQ